MSSNARSHTSKRTDVCFTIPSKIKPNSNTHIDEFVYSLHTHTLTHIILSSVWWWVNNGCFLWFHENEIIIIGHRKNKVKRMCERYRGKQEASEIARVVNSSHFISLHFTLSGEFSIQFNFTSVNFFFSNLFLLWFFMIIHHQHTLISIK